MKRLLIAIAVCCASYCARAAEPQFADKLCQELPSGWLFAAAFDDLAGLDAQYESLQEAGGPLLPRLRFLKQALGVDQELDSSGSLVIGGWTQAAEFVDRFFVLLPTTRHDDLISALQGDPLIENPNGRLGEFPILLRKRGQWLLAASANRSEQVDAASTRTSISERCRHVVERLTSSGAGGQMMLLVSPEGFEEIRRLASERRESLTDDDRIAGQQRMLAALQSQRWSIQSLAGATTLFDPMIEMLAQRELYAGCSLHRAANRTGDWHVEFAAARVDGSTPVSEPLPELPSREVVLPLVEASGGADRATVVAYGTVSQQLTEPISQWIAMAFRCTSELADVRQEQNPAWPAVETALRSIAVGTTHFEYVDRLPTTGEPPLASQSLLLTGESSADLAKHVESLVRAVNAVAEASPHARQRVVFDAEAVQIGGHPATRFHADLASEFGAAEVPEIRAILERLLGPGGRISVFVCPIDDHRLLVAQLPAAEVTGLADKLLVGASSPDDDATTTLIRVITRPAVAAQHRKLVEAAQNETGWPVEVTLPAGESPAIAADIQITADTLVGTLRIPNAFAIEAARSQTAKQQRPSPQPATEQ